MSSIFADLWAKERAADLERKSKQKQIANLWLRAIRARDARNKNTNTVITGEPGDGKSTLSLVMAEDLKPEVFVDHPQEAVDRYVTFSTGQFGRAVKSSPDGSVILGDEFGQQMHHRQFMTESSVQLSSLLQGFRYRRFRTFLNLPALRYIDPDAEGLVSFHAHVKEQGVAEVYRVTHPKFRGDDFHHRMIDRFVFRKPREELWKIYMIKKIVNQERVVDQAIRVADEAESRRLTDADIILEILKTPASYQREGRDGKAAFDAAAIDYSFGVGTQRAYQIIRKLKIRLDAQA